MRILVDTSVWIDFFNGQPSAEADVLAGFLRDEQELCTCGRAGSGHGCGAARQGCGRDRPGGGGVGGVGLTFFIRKTAISSGRRFSSCKQAPSMPASSAMSLPRRM